MFKKGFEKINYIVLISLVIFLSLSTWLVSFFGNQSLSLIRDILVLVLFFLSSRFVTQKKTVVYYLVSIFIAFGLISFFWREASLVQWLRGFRFTFVPLLLFLSLVGNKKISQKYNSIGKVIFWISCFILALAFLELAGIKLPLTSRFSGSLALEQNQFLQGSYVRRLQSILAGPNALGLYLLAVASFCFGLFRKLNPKYVWLALPSSIVLFLTFSRSSILGLLVVLLIVGYFFSVKKFGPVKTSGWIFSGILLLIFFTALSYRTEKFQSFITHGTSSSMRVDQYERVWQQKFDIGFLGRGSGTAGPSSQNRLDDGPNHWTENIYFDIFEELGLVGLLLYLSIIFYLFSYSWQKRSTYLGLTAFLLNVSFALAGLFINYYTGQVAIFMFWLTNGLLVGQGSDKMHVEE